MLTYLIVSEGNLATPSPDNHVQSRKLPTATSTILAMGFFRRISNAVLPAPPSSAGDTPSHVPRRATETYSTKIIDDTDSDLGSSASASGSRASWELSDSGSRASSEGSDSDSQDSRRSESSDSDSDSDYGGDRRQRDKYDMMTRYLWNTADRHGWFRDAEGDGLVSIR